MKKIIPFIGLAICGMIGIRAICYGILAICSVMYGFNMPPIANIFQVF